MNIIEVNINNEEKYLKQIAELEKKVLYNMESNGQIGQLFITGAEDISQYIHSKENTVLVSVNDNDNVEAATYITQGQSLFTYNDITKYFKVSDEYKKYVKSKYKSESEYKKAALEAYKLKMEAYAYARAKILNEFPQYTNISEFLQRELNSESKFDEKSQLREKINAYMFEYIENVSKSGNHEAIDMYEQFYFMTFSEIKDLIYGNNSKNVEIVNSLVKELEQNLQLKQEHERLSKKSHLIVYDENTVFEKHKYFSANPQNSIEIDTYITDPDQRSCGKARALVYEGIKKHISDFFENPENEEIFLCSTLHRDNVSSKYVSEFFGLKDNLFVNRRSGRDREVHITRIKRSEAQEYLRHMAEKLAVLYRYNPDNIEISNESKEKIIHDQIKYEKAEFHRLNKARHRITGYKPNVPVMYKKIKKIKQLKKNLDEISR